MFLPQENTIIIIFSNLNTTLSCASVLSHCLRTIFVLLGLWDHLKFIMYPMRTDDERDPRGRIQNGFETIRGTPGVFERTSMELDAETCSSIVEVRETGFEHLL